MNYAVKNCSTCFHKRLNLERKCPSMTEEFWSTECFAWCKDVNDWNERLKSVEKYVASVDEKKLRIPYTCSYCGRTYLAKQHGIKICHNCGRDNTSNLKRR